MRTLAAPLPEPGLHVALGYTLVCKYTNNPTRKPHTATCDTSLHVSHL